MNREQTKSHINENTAKKNIEQNKNKMVYQIDTNGKKSMAVIINNDLMRECGLQLSIEHHLIGPPAGTSRIIG